MDCRLNRFWVQWQVFVILIELPFSTLEMSLSSLPIPTRHTFQSPLSPSISLSLRMPKNLKP